MSFQKKIAIIALIIFLISMITIGAMMSSASRNVKYPPEIPTCPDYWGAKEQSESLAGEIMHQPKSICVPNPDLGDKSNMGTFIDKEMDFSPSQYQGPSGTAEKMFVG